MVGHKLGLRLNSAQLGLEAWAELIKNYLNRFNRTRIYLINKDLVKKEHTGYVALLHVHMSIRLLGS